MFVLQIAFALFMLMIGASMVFGGGVVLSAWTHERKARSAVEGLGIFFTGWVFTISAMLIMWLAVSQ